MNVVAAALDADIVEKEECKAPMPVGHKLASGVKVGCRIKRLEGATALSCIRVLRLRTRVRDDIAYTAAGCRLWLQN